MTRKIEFVTIGAHGWNEAAFFQALVAAGVDTFCDVRQRRGMRGHDYAFANSQRLQAKLGDLGIGYVHRRDLAPSPAARQRQYLADRANRTAKRSRTELDAGYVEMYRRECLDRLDSGNFLTSLGAEARVVAIFCVEREASACHRSLLAERLARDLGAIVTHIEP